MLTLIFIRQVAVPGAPVNITPPVISGTVQQGYTLSTTNGTWTNSPTSFTYQWQRDGSNIAGATAATYVLATADIGHTIRVKVTATNAIGSGSAFSLSTAIVTAPAGTGTTRKRIKGDDEEEELVELYMMAMMMEE